MGKRKRGDPPKVARRFNKQKYLRLSMHRNKTLARNRAGQLRKLGYSARVVKAPYPWGYAIYGKK